MKKLPYRSLLVACVVAFAAAMSTSHLWRWAWVCADAVLLPLLFKASKRYNSDVSVIVGQTEKHTIQFRRNEWSGSVRIAVDREIRLHKILSPLFRKFKRYELNVGSLERHEVAFVMRRPHLFAANPGRLIQVFVDGTVIQGS